MDRRRFLSILGGGAIGAILPYSFYRYLENGIDAHHIGVLDYIHDGPNAALQAITPIADFYLTSSEGEPSVDISKWSLAVDGLVDHALKFNYDEMRKLPPFETTFTLECISNPVGGPYIGNARWKGTRLRPLLERAGIAPKATHAILHAWEGYTTGIAVERLLAPENFLAWEMNGETLPRIHGYPLRIFLPGKYGMKQPKWLTRIEFVDQNYIGYWERQGWSNRCERQIQAVIDDPQDGARVKGPAILIVGYALAAETGISKVEISTDKGRTWERAEIFSNPSPYVWSFWKYSWKNPPPGKHTLLARATDGAGHLQTSKISGAWPDGATGYHTISMTVI